MFLDESLLICRKSFCWIRCCRKCCWYLLHRLVLLRL